MINVANALTMFRIVLVPVFVVALFIDSGESTTWRIAAFVIFAVAAITDQVDGRIARGWNLVTDFGKMADPIADKALIGAALLGLSILGVLPWWVTIVILAREIGVTVLRFWVIRHGVIAASRGGKLKTLLQAVAIGLFTLPDVGPLHTIGWIVMIAAVVATVVTGLDYVWQAIRLRKSGSASA
ncbi:CDP-diacylglycerol--glycerol-3-phosphate 3-phosphatidyltransferase [Gordonia sp. PDNC005]|nr:CDP-diacylglycerol--glycerol-3-phosphate 3-phosphatidyltransferase [Gordonia sp. PDNC005]